MGETFTTLTSKVVLLPVDDIDTDQIIPARYLKTTDKNGLVITVFRLALQPGWLAALGFRAQSARRQRVQLLFAGRNFRLRVLARARSLGAGRLWLPAVIAASFADIFRNNALKKMPCCRCSFDPQPTSTFQTCSKSCLEQQ